jgi:hypothetical protein
VSGETGGTGQSSPAVLERSLARLGWSSYFQDLASGELGGGGEGETVGGEVARVVAPHGGLVEVATASGELLASLAGKLRQAADEGEASRPAVGDWVLLDARPGEGTATIRAILPRRTKLSRKSAGRAAAEQVLAANVGRGVPGDRDDARSAPEEARALPGDRARRGRGAGRGPDEIGSARGRGGDPGVDRGGDRAGRRCTR